MQFTMCSNAQHGHVILFSFVSFLYSASLIQRTFLGYVKMYFVANCTLYQGFTILALEMLP